MFRRRLNRHPTFLVRLIVGFMVMIALGVALQLITGIDYTALFAFMAYIVYLPVSTLYGFLSIRWHEKRIRRFVKDHNLRLEKTGKRAVMSELGSVSHLQDADGQTIRHIIIGPDWKYGDLSYRTHHFSGDNDHTGVTVYYSIMSTQLSRALPNIVFDSRKSKGRQFRLQFSRRQIHSLEGDFDKFFVTYFPSGYTIDSMSFITPEVMWAMRAAADYDIEIYGDRLFLYSAVYDPTRQIPDMAAKLLAIKKELADNIDTYRDERLPYAEGRQKVSSEGVQLTVSLFWPVVTFLLILSWYIVSMWAKAHFE